MAEYDLFSPAFKANPFPTYAAMRQDAPVYPYRLREGGTIWFVTRYKDVEAILLDDKRFVKNWRKNFLSPEQRARRADAAAENRFIHNHLLSLDPPDHTRLRALVNKAFTPHIIGQMQHRIQAIAGTLLNSVQDKGEMDLIDAYAFPLPFLVIAELLGIPAAARDRLREWSNALVSPTSRQTGRRVKRELVSYLRHLFDQRRQNPQNDLVTSLLQAEETGDTLSTEELFSMVTLLIVAGHETTTNFIGNSTLALLQHPRQLERFQNDPRLAGAAIEELLRFEGPIETSTTRWAAQDVNLRGQTIRRGHQVRVVIAAADRDAHFFANPGTLNLARSDNRHLAFGRGIHYCLGAPLARMEARIALQILWQRLPDLRLKVPADQLPWRTGLLLRGLQKMPVAWS